VLLCDEATSALDPKTTHSILELIREINRKVASHIGDDPCKPEAGIRDDFKIALVGGFSSFFLVKQQLAEIYRLDANSAIDLRTKNITADKREQAISLGAALLAAGKIVLQRTARYSIGLCTKDKSGRVNALYYGIKYHSIIEPGKPYLVKWASDSEHPTIVNPVFHDVTISNTSTYEKAVSVGIVSFTGQYAPTKISEEGNITIFYLGDDNTFRYPDRAMDINAFRVYIYANTSLGDVNDDGRVNVTDVTMMVNHILGMEDENFNIENADVTRDGDVTVTDVAALVNLILNGNSVLKMVVNGADGLTFGKGGNGPARAANGE
jgi:hypothetical protein